MGATFQEVGIGGSGADVIQVIFQAKAGKEMAETIDALRPKGSHTVATDSEKANCLSRSPQGHSQHGEPRIACHNCPTLRIRRIALYPAAMIPPAGGTLHPLTEGRVATGRPRDQ